MARVAAVVVLACLVVGAAAAAPQHVHQARGREGNACRGHAARPAKTPPRRARRAAGHAARADLRQGADARAAGRRAARPRRSLPEARRCRQTCACSSASGVPSSSAPIARGRRCVDARCQRARGRHARRRELRRSGKQTAAPPLSSRNATHLPPLRGAPGVRASPGRFPRQHAVREGVQRAAHVAPGAQRRRCTRATWLLSPQPARGRRRVSWQAVAGAARAR